MKKRIELEGYARCEHFKYFCSMAYPYVGITVEVDISALLDVREQEKTPLFLALNYCAVRAANAVPEFRRRVEDGGIVEYDWCNGSYTFALPDESYCYCSPDCRAAFGDYLAAAEAEQRAALTQPSLDDGDDPASLLFISSFPWFSQTALVQPVPYPADSNPRISWGRYFTRDGRRLLPVSLLCHHALVDALHISRFLTAFDSELSALALKLTARDAASK